MPLPAVMVAGHGQEMGKMGEPRSQVKDTILGARVCSASLVELVRQAKVDSVGEGERKRVAR